MWRAKLTIRKTVLHKVSGCQGPARHFLSTQACGKPSRAKSPASSAFQLWTQEEDQKLLSLGAARVPGKDLEAMFSGRSLSAIRSHRVYLQARSSAGHDPGAKATRVPFSEAENETIKRLVAEGRSWRDVRAALPGRHSLEVVARQGRKLAQGSKQRRERAASHAWTPSERQLALHLRETEGLSAVEVARRFGLRVDAVRYLYRRVELEHGMKSATKAHKWTAEEDQILLRCREKGMTSTEITAVLTSRSLSAINTRWYRHRSR